MTTIVLHFKMNYRILYGLEMVILCWSKVNGQSSRDDIVSPSVVEARGTFTVTCDASRAGVPTNATTVAHLFITHRRGTIYRDLAIYSIYIYPYEIKVEPFTIPPRYWTYNFEGSLRRGTADQPKNRNTMKIKLVIRDARCSDDGTYICRGMYISSNGQQTNVKGLYQNLSIAHCETYAGEIIPSIGPKSLL
ncbi:uncharacterized protein LOC131936212 [Physella acuta]|uniref:uncharacterized protein LOC131936212 n=1 Tax=Physella acuta TaxID=109671 RepID=UPI0027DE69CE|nr:uncharacterized protein LOC131936212 [Physella acuta]